MPTILSPLLSPATMKQNTLKASLAALLLLSLPALAATVTLSPTADAYVQAGTNAAKNYGSNTQLRAQTNATTSSNYDSYLKFDTSSASGSVTSAKLRLYASLSASGTVSSSAYGIANTTWAGTTLTWNNKPALGTSLGSVTVNATSYAWKEIDVTAYVQSEKTAGRNVLTLALHNGASSSPYVRTNSRNATSNPPQLVIISNAAPTVSILTPAPGSSYTAPASINLTANAADSDGTVQKVEYFNGTTLIGSATAAPYTYSWSNVPAGSYILTARATDNSNAVTTSAPFSITINQPVVHGTFYIYADQLNTPRLITDTTNKVVWRWDADPFGDVAPNEDPDGDGITFTYNQRFPGQYYDQETGLHYNYFRNYDPGTGRYIESDPIGLDGGSLSTYTYVDNDPLSYVDPDGLIRFPRIGGSKPPGMKPPRWSPNRPGEGKPTYKANPAHDPKSPKYNPNKTPEPSNCQDVYKKAIPDDPYNPRHWWGKNDDGNFYRYHNSNDGTAHFSGTFDRRAPEIPPYVRSRLGY